MKYQANPVMVDAFKIVGIGPKTPEGTLLALDNGESVVATPGMTSRMTPIPNDYWVIQEDGYVYLNPASVFERKYSLIHEPGEGTIDSQGHYSGDPAGAEILAAVPELRRKSNG